MRILVEAVEQLADADWDLLDEDYDGCDREPREGEVSDTLADAGFGHCGAYDVPTKMWNDCVPKSVINQIRKWKEETSKYVVHPLTHIYKTSCKVLLRDGLLHEPSSVRDKNAMHL